MSEVPEGFRHAGKGLNVFEAEPVEGPLKWLETPQDVIAFVNSPDLEDTIVLSRGGTTTFMAPVLTMGCKGLVTLQGGTQSHLGIVSREFGIPCVMSTQFSEGRELPTGETVPEDGTIVRLQTDTDGTHADVYVKEA